MTTNHCILVIDDDPKLERALSSILRTKGYAYVTVAAGKEALDRIEEKVPAVALIDLGLEDMSGLKVMEEIKECCPGTTECILLTGRASQASAIEAVNLGAYSYMQKPYDVEQLLVTIRKAIEEREAEEALRESEAKYSILVENSKDGTIMIQDGVLKFINNASIELVGYSPAEMIGADFLDFVAPDYRELVLERYTDCMVGKEAPSRYEIELLRKDGSTVPVELNAVRINIQGKPTDLAFVRDITERKRVKEKLQQTYVELQRALEGTISVLVSAIEMRDPYTAGHQRRVTQLACAIAREMGLPEEQIEGIRMAGLIHDLGKISIPAEILSKPGRLNDFQWGMIQTHSQVGYDVLKAVEFPWPVAEIVLQHHERLDGSGYPAGLPGEEIMLEARILAVADVVEAMASRRPYRPPPGIDKALKEISQNRGILYDSEVVDACLKLFIEKEFTFEKSLH